MSSERERRGPETAAGSRKKGRFDRESTGAVPKPLGKATEKAPEKPASDEAQGPVPVFHVGDVVETRRTHPCGGVTWEVYRVGMDIGMRCTTCGRRVMVPRRRFERRVRRVVSRAQGGRATP